MVALNGILPEIPYWLIIIVEVIIIIVVTVILERLTTRYLRRFAKRRELPPNVGNGLVLVSRFLILLGAVMAFLRVGGVSAELLVTVSALGGAAVGFASTRTVGNFIAGLYVLVVRPFRVHDYVRIGNVEGIVEEITLNYTKILTSTNTTVLISNQRVLDQDIINYRYKGTAPPLYCYNFELTFSHTFPTDHLEKIFDEVIEQYVERLPRKPRYETTKITHVARHYTFYLYVEDPRDIFTLRPTFVKNITEAWDKERLGAQPSKSS